MRTRVTSIAISITLILTSISAHNVAAIQSQDPNARYFESNIGFDYEIQSVSNDARSVLQNYNLSELSNSFQYDDCDLGSIRVGSDCKILNVKNKYTEFRWNARSEYISDGNGNTFYFEDGEYTEDGADGEISLIRINSDHSETLVKLYDTYLEDPLAESFYRLFYRGDPIFIYDNKLIYATAQNQQLTRVISVNLLNGDTNYNILDEELSGFLIDYRLNPVNGDIIIVREAGVQSFLVETYSILGDLKYSFELNPANENDGFTNVAVDSEGNIHITDFISETGEQKINKYTNVGEKLSEMSIPFEEGLNKRIFTFDIKNDYLFISFETLSFDGFGGDPAEVDYDSNAKSLILDINYNEILSMDNLTRDVEELNGQYYLLKRRGALLGYDPNYILKINMDDKIVSTFGGRENYSSSISLHTNNEIFTYNFRGKDHPSSEDTGYSVHTTSLLQITSDNVSQTSYFTWNDTSRVGRNVWNLIGNANDEDLNANVVLGDGDLLESRTLGGNSIDPTIELDNRQGGPVVITGDDNFYSTQRVLFNGSFNEFEGIKDSELTSKYYFTWYDNRPEVNVNSWILVGNPNPEAVNVRVTIGGVVVDEYEIAGKSNVARAYDVDPVGPVVVESVDGTSNIYTTQRTLFRGSFNEYAGIAADNLDNEYLFTWYDTRAIRNNHTWILVGNPNTESKEVDIYIGDMETPRERVNVPSGGNLNVKYEDVLGGPVKVVSVDGSDIYASQRSLIGGSFNEYSGIRVDNLVNEYYFTWYDNRISRGNKTWILLGNSGLESIEVNVEIGGVLREVVEIAGGSSVAVSYDDVLEGPVRVYSIGGESFYSSQRALIGGSFNEYSGIDM